MGPDRRKKGRWLLEFEFSNRRRVFGRGLNSPIDLNWVEAIRKRVRVEVRRLVPHNEGVSLVDAERPNSKRPSLSPALAWLC